MFSYVLFHIEGTRNKWLDLCELLFGLTCAMLNNQTYGFLPEPQIKFVLKLGFLYF